MTRKIQLLAGVALMATLLTACSNQKFSFRKKIPVNREESVVAKAPERPKPARDIPVPEEAPEMAKAANAPAAIPGTHFIAKQNELNKAPVVAHTQHKKNAEKRSVKEARKLISKKSDVQKAASSINPRQFIIIGLIILLIGVVLSIVLSGLGYLVAVVGVVFIIIGLILILADNL